jgi:hypothetical protein
MVEIKQSTNMNLKRNPVALAPSHARGKQRARTTYRAK